MSREFSQYAGSGARKELELLLDNKDNYRNYRASMYKLGKEIGSILQSSLRSKDMVLLVCTVEDADYLAKGVAEQIEETVGKYNLLLACFWNERKEIGKKKIAVAPIVRRYIEDFSNNNIDCVVIVKSIISGACVVRTNLMELLDNINPSKIVIASPVMYYRAQEMLDKEFPSTIREKFNYLYFAKDDERDENGVVSPGVGGNVYHLLGLGDQTQKNRILPDFIKSRLYQSEKNNVFVA